MAQVSCSTKMSGMMGKIKEHAVGSSQMATSLASTMLTMALVVAVSVFLYGTFYYAYMPTELVDMPVHLEFDPCEGQTSHRCTYPSASLALGRRHQMLQGQVYSIRMVLEVPDSPSNEELGMFMACMNITGARGDLVTTACRSSLASYRSPLLRTLETLVLAPFLVTGWAEQKQTIPITFYDSFHPDPHTKADTFHVTLKSKLVQVTTASLHISASLSGLRHLMYRHSWLSAILGVGTNIAILLTIILVSWTRFRLGDAEHETVEVEEELEEEDPAAAEAAEEEEEGEATVEEATTPSQSICNKLKWFLIRMVFKQVLRVVKVAVLVGLAVVSYEAAMQGEAATKETVLEAAKEDLVNLGTIVIAKTGQVVALLRQAREE